MLFVMLWFREVEERSREHTARGVRGMRGWINREKIKGGITKFGNTIIPIEEQASFDEYNKSVIRNTWANESN